MLIHKATTKTPPRTGDGREPTRAGVLRDCSFCERATLNGNERNTRVGEATRGQKFAGRLGSPFVLIASFS